MKQVRSDLVCHIGRVLPLLVTVLCEGVLLALPNPVLHPSASGWVPWYPACRKPFDPKPQLAPIVAVNDHVCQQSAGGCTEQRESAEASTESVHLAVNYAILACLTKSSADVRDLTPPCL